MRPPRPLFIVLPLICAGSMAMGILNLVRAGMVLDSEAILFALVHAVCWSIPAPLAALAEARLNRFVSPIPQVLVLLSICFLAALAGDMLFGVVCYYADWICTPQLQFLFGADGPIPVAFRWAAGEVQEPLVVTVATLMLARFLLLQEREKERVLRADRLVTRLSEARLQLLRSQLNPHFLFNSLNSVATLIGSDDLAASTMLERLIGFYGIVSATEGKPFVRVAEEVAFIREYLMIEQSRFGARLSAQIDADRASLDALVPPLLLQPIAENAIKHGIARIPGPGSIHLRIACDQQHVRFVVENSGRAIDAARARDGVGLANTRERLRQTYGGDQELRAEAAGRRGTRVTVTIPYHTTEVRPA
jgi:multisubunit Na+/H+ antiporter MnhC subunit